MKQREHLFGFADSRGNNPHGTRENFVDEGRRLNAKRYETVQQMDQALDARARGGARMPGLIARPMGNVPANLPNAPAPRGGPSLLETLFIFAAGAGLVYLLTRKDEDDDEPEEGELRVNSLAAPPAVPALTPPAPVTVVLSNPAAAPQPNQTVVPVVVSPAEEPPRRRRRRNPPIAAPVTVTVEPAPASTKD